MHGIILLGDADHSKSDAMFGILHHCISVLISISSTKPLTKKRIWDLFSRSTAKQTTSGFFSGIKCRALLRPATQTWSAAYAPTILTTISGSKFNISQLIRRAMHLERSVAAVQGQWHQRSWWASIQCPQLVAILPGKSPDVLPQVKYSPLSVKPLMKYLKLSIERVKAKIFSALPEKIAVMFDRWSYAGTKYVLVFSYSTRDAIGYRCKCVAFSPIEIKNDQSADGHVQVI